jgi:alpha-glucosidase
MRLTLDAPLDRIPVLVRAGTVLPMETEDTLQLNLYPPVKDVLQPETASPSSSDLYSDSGDGYGAWRLDRFHLLWEGDILKLHREDRGDYPFPYQEIVLHLQTAKAGTVWVDGKDYPIVQNRVKTPLFREARFKIESLV